MVEKVPLEEQPPLLRQSFQPFSGDLGLDALENKQKLRQEATGGDANDDEVDERADVEREVTRMLSQRRGGGRHAQPPRKQRRGGDEQRRGGDEPPQDDVSDGDSGMEGGGSDVASATDDKQDAASDIASDDGSGASVSDESASSADDAKSTAQADVKTATDQPPAKDKKTLYREEREDLLWQLKKLERSKIQVPVVDNCTSLEELRRIIKDIRRESLFDSNINSLKTFLITVLHGVEWVGTQQLGLNLTGFAEHEQLYKMDEYDKHLIALSDRSYLGWSEGLPPEFSIIIALVTNTSLYILQNKKKPMKRNAMQGPSSII